MSDRPVVATTAQTKMGMRKKFIPGALNLNIVVRKFTALRMEDSPLMAAVMVEKNVMLYILFFIVIVAAFGITCTLITFIVMKTREIGLLKALGASNQQVMWVFLGQSLIVSVLGTAGYSSGVTYNGVAMTRLFNNGGYYYTTLWSLRTPTAGTHNVVVSGVPTTVYSSSASYFDAIDTIDLVSTNPTTRTTVTQAITSSVSAFSLAYSVIGSKLRSSVTDSSFLTP